MKKIDVLNLVTCSMLVGFIIYIILFGVYTLNPLNTGWIFYEYGDTQAQYIAFLAYKNSPGFFSVDSLNYPNHVSIVYYDIVPAFAILFKLITKFINVDELQYHGLFICFTFMMQSLCAAILLKKYIKSNIKCILGAAIFILLPAMLFRIFHHNALTAQFIILMGFIPFVYYEAFQKKKYAVSAFYALLGFLTVCLHPYFIIHCLINISGYLLYDCMKSKRIKFPTALISYLIPIFVLYYVLNVFDSGMEYKASGFGQYNFNLNGFFNPLKYSSFFPKIKYAYEQQYEGFSYLGCGVFIIFFLAICVRIKYLFTGKINTPFKKEEYSDMLFIFLLSVLCASLPNLTLNTYSLLKVHFADGIYNFLSVFRSSGRFIWNAMYIIVFLSIILTVKNYRYALTLIIICIILQVYDVKSFFFRFQEKEITTEEYSVPENFSFEFLDKNPQIKTIYTNNDFYNDGVPWDGSTAQYEAVKRGIKINYGHSARDLKNSRGFADALMTPEKSEIFIYPVNKIPQMKYVYKQPGKLYIIASAYPLNSLEKYEVKKIKKTKLYKAARGLKSQFKKK